MFKSDETTSFSVPKIAVKVDYSRYPRGYPWLSTDSHVICLNITQPCLSRVCCSILDGNQCLQEPLSCIDMTLSVDTKTVENLGSSTRDPFLVEALNWTCARHSRLLRHGKHAVFFYLSCLFASPCSPCCGRLANSNFCVEFLMSPIWSPTHICQL